MVLQQESKLPVWGWADPGEEVTVTFGDQSGKATAAKDGSWRVDLKPVASSSVATTLTVTGRNNITIQDVLVGEVWICSGQSNMAFNLHSAHNAAKVVPEANDPQMRFFVVSAKISLQPETEVGGNWKVCTPEIAKGFSGVGYFFGQELRKTLQRPVGLIGSYWGGTPAQSWTSLEGLEKAPPFANYVDAFNKIVSGLEQAKKDYPAALASYEEEQKQWQAEIGPTFDAAMKEWAGVVKKAKTEGQLIPPLPTPSKPKPKAPPVPGNVPQYPTVLYNGMIAPLIPYAIKGAIWYQGESNGGMPLEYRTLFPRMITDWREKWGEGDFPFLFVQLANFTKRQTQPSEQGWAWLREAQLMTLSLPNTGMASAIDVGNGGDIHPTDKYDVGLRLALAARHVAYGQELVYSGPIYESMKIAGDTIRLAFKHAGKGLTIGVPPWAPTGVPAMGSELTGFAIAGADKKWFWGKATIEGDAVLVQSAEVPAPVAVRYAWASNPAANLYNKDGLPASSFRTDNWTDSK